MCKGCTVVRLIGAGYFTPSQQFLFPHSLPSTSVCVFYLMIPFCICGLPFIISFWKFLVVQFFFFLLFILLFSFPFLTPHPPPMSPPWELNSGPHSCNKNTLLLSSIQKSLFNLFIFHFVKVLLITLHDHFHSFRFSFPSFIWFCLSFHFGNAHWHFFRLTDVSLSCVQFLQASYLPITML